ncbi:MAG TPA: TonB-dependent receptor [Candidatus Acidoferrum sp.]|nr:TonB-dependent receptor [Candidatus Acidoferrum sp.]
MRSRASGFSIVGFLAVLLAFFVAVPRAEAQSTTDGAIGGTVTDPSGAVVPNAAVSSRNLGTSSSSSGVTDGGGRYLLIHLQPGVYSLEISGSGFGVFKATNITVEVGRVTAIDATLTVKALAETIVATAELPVITTDRADFTTNINQTTIDNLPINGRRWSTFALSTPGAVPDGGFGLVSFRGISGLLNNNTVDGADNNQAFFSEERGRTRISYSTSAAAIQEFQINTSNYSAEYGRSAGGVVNAVTKSGSNQLHGQAFWYDRTSDLGAVNPFSFKSQLVNGVATRRPFLPPDKRHQFGGGIGGPVIKDKLFFFFSGDQQLRGFPAIADSGTPGAIVAPLTAAELTTLSGRGVSAAQANAGVAFLQSLTGEVPRTGDQLILLPKIDWNLTSKHHVSVSYNRLRWASPAGVQTAGVVSRGIESFGSDFVKEDWGIARLNSSISSTFTNELRYQIGRDFEYQIGQNPISGEPVSAQGVSPQVFVGGVGNFTFGKPNFLDRRAFPKETRNQVADTLSWSHGTHLLRFGFDFNHVNDVEDNLFRESGDYSYSTRADYLSDFAAAANKLTPRCTFTPAAPAPPFAVPCYSSFNQQLGPSKFTFSTNDLAFFVQDDWRVKPYFTVNFGLRYETELMPSPQIANSALPLTRKLPNDYKGVGPRLGFAWDLTHNGKTIVRAGYGIFYGRIINSTIANAITNTGVLSSSQLGFFFLPSTAGAPAYPNVLSTAPPPASFTPQVVQFAPHTSNPMVHEFDIDFQREIAANTVVSVSYLGSLGGNLPRFVDINLNAPASTVAYTISGGAQNGQTISAPLFKGPRPNPAFNSITDISNSVTSKYNALVVALNRRFYQGFQIQTSFTYSHARDAGQSSQTFTVANNVLNPFDLSQEQGRSNFDVRERFNFGAVWTPDLYKGSRLILKELVNGFTISPLISISSGAPYTALIQGNAPGGVSSGVLGAGGTNRVPFLAPNSFQMPRTANVDLRLEKSFRLTEGRRFTLTADAFNALNRTNFTALDNQIYTICAANAKCSVTGLTPTVNQLLFNSHFGIPTSSSNSLLAQRQIQIGARLDF